MRPIQNVKFSELFHITGVPPHPPGFALWHIVEQGDPVRSRSDCPQSKLGVSVLVRNIPGHLKVLDWGTEVEIVERK